MGWVSVGEESVAVDDRTLRHLQLAIGAALSVGESFHLSWWENGIGRTSVWISPSTSIRFRFASAPPSDINPRWVMALRLAASSAAGISVTSDSELQATMSRGQRPVVALREHPGQWGPLASPK